MEVSKVHRATEQNCKRGWQSWQLEPDEKSDSNGNKVCHKMLMSQDTASLFNMNFMQVRITYYLSLSCLESCCFLATFREMLLPSSSKCEW